MNNLDKISTEIDLIEYFLHLAATPVGLQCCQLPNYKECCGNPEAVYMAAEDVLDVMNEYRKQRTEEYHKLCKDWRVEVQ